MSVNLTTYIVWGAKVPYPKLEDGEEDRLYELYEKPASFYHKPSEPLNNENGITAILDGMGGTYMIVGHILDRTHDYDGFNSNPVVLPRSPTVGGPDDNTLEYLKWRNAIETCLKEYGHTDPVELNWMVVNNYT